jgi:hypothetical protein
VLVNGYALNHTALSVHRIAGGPGDIYAFASDLASRGFKMNDEGGLMKVRQYDVCAVSRHSMCVWV